MYLKQLPPGGLRLFAEEKLTAWIKSMSPRFFPRKFSHPPDNVKGNFSTNLNFFTGSDGWWIKDQRYNTGEFSLSLIPLPPSLYSVTSGWTSG